MTPTEFELLTKKLFSERLKNEFGYDIPVDHEKSFTSLAGNTYKVDISYSFKLFDIDYLTLVECKYWNSSVSREKVGYFKSVLDELKAHKGVIVTTRGFQSGAITYAQSQNIALIKITNDKYFDTWSHFDGAIDLLSDKLNKGKPLNPNESYTSFGLFTPQKSVSEFIANHYGKDLVAFLENDFSPDILDDPNADINPIIKEQILKMPDNWYNDYVRYETAGLNYKMKNEPEIRLINMTLYLLKMGQKSSQ
jgi:hypothetical protein